jgi:DNA repair protein RadD
MSAPDLRPYQEGVIARVWAAIGAAQRRILVVAPTGSGKTVIIAEIISQAVLHGQRVLFLAHRRELISQASKKLHAVVSGSVEVVCNCAVLTEGFDAPAAACLVLARPTKSLGLFRQMIGRVLRPSPGKIDALILDHAGAVFAHGFPDDPIDWYLSEDRRAENKAHAARGTYKAPALTSCPECSAIRFEGKPCTACGWRPRPKPVDVDVADGDLGEVDRSRRVAGAGVDPRRFHGMLAYIGRERGYQPGWAAHKFKEKFGTWPATRYPDPMPPDDAVRAWVRSRQIAFAKSQARKSA